MILLESYDVLEKAINQNFEKCKGEGSTLFVRRIDVVAFIAVRLPRKKAIVRCNNTGKKIPKKLWNEETQAEAEKLLSQHKTPKLGYFLFVFIIIGIIGGASYSFINYTKSANVYEKSFIAKSDEEKTIILESLGKDDVLLISNSIYRIKSVDDEKVVLEKSTFKIDGEKINSFNPIDESLIPKNTFTDLYEVKKEDFINNKMQLDNRVVMILQYLDN